MAVDQRARARAATAAKRGAPRSSSSLMLWTARACFRHRDAGVDQPVLERGQLAVLEARDADLDHAILLGREAGGLEVDDRQLVRRPGRARLEVPRQAGDVDHRARDAGRRCPDSGGRSGSSRRRRRAKRARARSRSRAPRLGKVRARAARAKLGLVMTRLRVPRPARAIAHRQAAFRRRAHGAGGVAARARARGALVLRIEDVDRPRVVPGAAEAIMDDLRWLGLDWDEGPDVGGALRPVRAVAAQRALRRALERLARAGLVFRCSCTRAELMAASSAPHGDLGPRYPGTCRERPARSAPHVLAALSHGRGRARSSTRCTARSRRRRATTSSCTAPTGCTRISSRSSSTTSRCSISEVVRGADLLSSTPRQLALYRALGASRRRSCTCRSCSAPTARAWPSATARSPIADYRARALRARARRARARQRASASRATGEPPAAPVDLLARFDVARIAARAERARPGDAD